MNLGEINDTLSRDTYAVAKRSLGAPMYVCWIGGILLFVLACIPFSMLMKVQDAPKGLLSIGLTVWLFVSSFLVAPILRFFRVRQLANLQLPISAVDYLDALNQGSSQGELELVVRWKGNQTVAANVQGVPYSIHSEPGVWRITSQVFETLDHGTYITIADNRPLHQCFLQIADLLQLTSTACPIESIQVRRIALGTPRS